MGKLQKRRFVSTLDSSLILPLWATGIDLDYHNEIIVIDYIREITGERGKNFLVFPFAGQTLTRRAQKWRQRAFYVLGVGKT